MSSQWISSLGPPPGVEPNFVNPPNQIRENIALHTVCLTLATSGIILRLYTRALVLRTSLGIDDYFCIVSWMLSVTFSGLMCEAYHWEIGRHMWDEPLPWLVPAFKFFTVAQYIYLAMTATIKLTFLTFYYRIFAPQRTMRYLIIGGIVFVTLSHLIMLFLTIFSCTPVSHAWNKFGAGTCWIPPSVLPYLSGALSSATDLYVLGLPIKSLWGLNMKLASRFRIIGVFMIGILYSACIASLIRLGKTHILEDSSDSTWNISHIAIWAVIECNVGIFCSCLMLLPKFIERYVPDGLLSSVTRLWSSKRSSRRESKGQDSMDSFPISASSKPHAAINWNPPSGAESTVEIKATARNPETRAFV